MEGTASLGKQTYIPQVEEARKPKVGMAFPTVEEGYEFYNAYAREAGFSVRSSSCKYALGSSSKCNKDRELIWKMYVCSKEGHTDEKPEASRGQVKRCRGEMREDCKALITLKKNKSGSSWIVNKFIEEHCHALAAPHNTHLLRSHRKVSKAKKSSADSCASDNILASRQMRAFKVHDGAYDDIGCTEQDLKNCESDKKEETKGQDAQILYDHFKEMKEMNPSFTFTMKTDHQNRVTHCFWTDSTSRVSYNYFGDVVSFDTIYNTNRYQMIFALFMGVNHHGHSIIFGGGFLQDATTESFVWLFEQWLEAMPGGPPKAIITDQYPAMVEVIARVLPYTYQRYSIWHIMQRMREKLGAAANKDGFNDTFKDCVCESKTPDDFEIRWKKMLKDNDLEDNAWLKSLYEMRQKWIPAYLKHMFFAGISTIQRSERIKSFVEKYVSKKNTLYDFILRFEREAAHQRHLELKADHKTVSSMPKFKTPLAMERKMAGTYTRVKFHKFQDELMMTMAYTVELDKDNEQESCYRVGHLEKHNEHQQMVVFKKVLEHAICSCHNFEFEGMPCRHVLCVLIHVKIAYLPTQYILKRWTRQARDGSVLDKMGVEVKEICNDTLIARHSDLSHFATMITYEAALSKEAYQYARERFTEIQKEVREINLKVGAVVVQNSQMDLCEPESVRSNESGMILRSLKENPQTKELLYCGCNKHAISHDKCNCPAVKNCWSVENANEASSEFLESHDVSENEDSSEIFSSDNGNEQC